MFDAGKVGELRVASELQARGYAVSWPLSEMLPYDLIAERDGVCILLQVKSTFGISKDRNCYEIRSSKDEGKNAYSERDCAFIISCIVPNNVFYVIPVSRIQGVRKIRFYPDAPHRGSYEIYRDGWGQLDEFVKAKL